MDNGTTRRYIVFALVFMVVASVLGLALALSPTAGHAQTVARIAGALGIVPGLYLLSSSNIFARDDGRPLDLQDPALQMARVRLRIVGVTVMLMGVAQWTAEPAARTTLLTAAAVVSMLGVFRVPRRLFTTSNSKQ